MRVLVLAGHEGSSHSPAGRVYFRSRAEVNNLPHSVMKASNIESPDGGLIVPIVRSSGHTRECTHDSDMIGRARK
jgi:hypothetical protein